MADLTPAKANIQTEEARFRYAVSESLMQKVGAATNFINKRQYDVKDFRLNGPYDIVAAPQNAVDGIYIFPFDCEIINIAIYNFVPGASGTTELDIKKCASSTASWSTIFTTTPKITSAAVDVDGSYGLSYDITDEDDGQSWAAATPGTGVTLGVLSSVPFNISAGEAIRMDKIQHMTGAQNCGLLIYFRPR